MNTVSALLSLSLATVAFTQNCPENFVMIDDTCYHLTIDAAPMTWKQARLYCQNLMVDGSADLATVAHCDQFHELYVYHQVAYNSVDYWMGGSDEDTPGMWHWVTGAMMPKGHPFWYPGQPSSSNEHCVYMHVNGHFFTEYCENTSYQKYAMCQWLP